MSLDWERLEREGGADKRLDAILSVMRTALALSKLKERWPVAASRVTGGMLGQRVAERFHAMIERPQQSGVEAGREVFTETLRGVLGAAAVSQLRTSANIAETMSPAQQRDYYAELESHGVDLPAPDVSHRGTLVIGGASFAIALALLIVSAIVADQRWPISDVPVVVKLVGGTIGMALLVGLTRLISAILVRPFAGRVFQFPASLPTFGHLRQHVERHFTSLAAEAARRPESDAMGMLTVLFAESISVEPQTVEVHMKIGDRTAAG